MGIVADLTWCQKWNPSWQEQWHRLQCSPPATSSILIWCARWMAQMKLAVWAIPDSIRTVWGRGKVPGLYLSLWERGGGCSHLHQHRDPEQEEVWWCLWQVQRLPWSQEKCHLWEHTAKPEITEIAEQYITSLYSLAEDCEFGDMKDTLIHDHLAVSIRNIVLLEWFQTGPDLDLDKEKRMICQWEAVWEQ